MAFKEILVKVSKYCAYQERCLKEVKQKLNTLEANEEETDEALLYLYKNNFLNEERYACSYAKGKFNNNQWGKQKIKIHLRQKDIPTNLIEKGLQQIDINLYKQTANKLALNKWNSLSDHKKKRHNKTFQYLYQKGFETDIILLALENIQQ